jgi:2-polyprenyl-3-methyl-5-hydroxy-6-metoxy-1,4-benzoquinol methylase
LSASAPLFDDPAVRDPYLQHYETIRGRVRTAIVQRHLMEVLPAIAGSQSLRVLDVGCGDGRDSAWLAGAGHEVVGYDSSSKMIDGALEKYGSRDWPDSGSLTFLQGTQRHALKAFGSEAFDLVLSHGVIMYQTKPKSFIAEHLKLTRANGSLSLVAKNADALVHRAAREASLDAALELLDDSSGLGHLGVMTHAQSIQEVSDLAFEDGASVRSWAGVRMFTDTPTDLIAGADEDKVIELEWRACRKDPHRQVAALLHVVLLKGIDLSLLPQ